MFLAFAASFVCTPVAVFDGDGPIWCEEGEKIRIASISAREMDGSCSPGHPCPKASAIAARDTLVNLLGTPTGKLRTGHITIRAKPIRCRAVGESYGRIVAHCRLSDGRDLGDAMIKTGTVLPWK